MEKRGMFVVLEGIDGAGTSTQIFRLAEHMWSLNKYARMLITHEPTERANLIRGQLAQSTNAYSDGERLSRAYTDDRKIHGEIDIIPALKKGQHALSDRYKMSTVCYQQTQGVDLEVLLALHEDPRIVIPIITYFIDVSAETALLRMQEGNRKREKFEDSVFLEELVGVYRAMYEKNKTDPRIVGPCVRIDGERSIKEVTQQITDDFTARYMMWSTSNHNT